ncbi:unnamed protein product (macronuclear) [Paramecium tetraurelia]|uniref:PX domain-containing protein n=1 Tax=Paramecium tetraurelia TaxID=5888 RepID=A0C9A3_PARTE|nr:uncharacterized protein GSPATT00006676001 [Paramecium tetraurelia]CAK67370.1 unnamed protein product [Paramecium tetraurelia]|eukprot:XP_001434767.1 hypothetical protein (macronuclear) [Paramecium tetraurelia strain d4-2]
MQNNIIDQNKIVVTVKDPTINQNQEEFVLYNIEGQDNAGDFQIQHRFSEFFQLRSLLAQKWQYCYIPALPPKVVQGNLSLKVIYQRLMMLDHFMKQLSNFSFLWYSHEVQAFLRQQQLRKSNSNEQQENYANLLISIFPHFAENVIDQEVETKIDQFLLFIQNATPILQNYKVIMKSKLTISKQHFEQINIFQTFFIPEYEKILETNVEQIRSRQTSKIFQEDQSNCVLSDTDKQFYIMYIQIKIELNEFQVLIELIQKREQLKLQIQTLNEQLQRKVKYVSEIQNNGLNIIKQLVTTKEDEIEKAFLNLKQLEKELTIQVSFFSLITNKLASDIQLLKKVFSQNYYQVVREMSKLFKQNAQKDQNISFYQNLLLEIEKSEL